MQSHDALITTVVHENKLVVTLTITTSKSRIPVRLNHQSIDIDAVVVWQLGPLPTPVPANTCTLSSTGPPPDYNKRCNDAEQLLS